MITLSWVEKPLTPMMAALVNTWNVTPVDGNNIMNGSVIAGNYWATRRKEAVLVNRPTLVSASHNLVAPM